ncbi:hypothetical protein [uncultured Bacteroides sp.]|uniref:hypothetical protein n=1 Tax=uncultured Bacteroides sp. TaxID=162156 RepID=UPI0025DC1610|nr:hypothetical protein [uncultured Bacteroides sp.]
MRMKQKISISRFPICFGLLLLLFSIPQLLSAQEGNDSIRIIRNDMQILPEGTLFQYATPDLFPAIKINKTHSLYPSKQLNEYPANFSRKGEIYLPYYTNPSPLFKGDYSTSGILWQFPHGAVFGSGSQTSVPGIGLFNNASLGYQHVFNDRFELRLRADAMKINMMHSTGQVFSTSGALLYHASDRVAFKVFGSYDIGNSYGMSTHSYGATMSVDMSDRFNMEMGVQRYYDAMRGRWETVPVVIPSYRFNNKFSLGLDVGGILYEILRDVVFDKRGGGDYGGGPTIGPPRTFLPIRPR